MADMLNPILSIVVTDKASKLSDLVIGDKQLIFASDKRIIALDMNGKRKFYNQIEVLATEQDRKSLESPVDGLFYFVIKSTVMWTYNDSQWIQITTRPSDIVFIGTNFPEFGSDETLYVDKDKREISVWDSDSNGYKVVSNYMAEATSEDILSIFNK